jgi:uncharacterized protein
VRRIRKAYLAKFRAGLRQLGARQIERGVELLMTRAAAASHAGRITLNDALAQADARLQRQSERFASTRRGPGSGARRDAPPVFVCDAGLGGLARWLRAAGYEAHWSADIDDNSLLREAEARQATLLTTDSMLLERVVIRDGVIPTVWIPPAGHPAEQLAQVFRALHLAPRAPRCMACGGELRLVDKAAVAARIPPRTARWLDEYFGCTRCDRLFWRGTHWQRIQAKLRALAATPSA